VTELIGDLRELVPLLGAMPSPWRCSRDAWRGEVDTVHGEPVRLIRTFIDG
jgi:hypothetical protein